MKGIEIGRSIGSIAAAPRIGVGRVGGFGGIEGPKVAISMRAQALTRDFAPIQIPRSNLPLGVKTPIPEVFRAAFREPKVEPVRVTPRPQRVFGIEPKVSRAPRVADYIVQPKEQIQVSSRVGIFTHTGTEIQPQAQSKVVAEVAQPQVKPQVESILEENVTELIQEQKPVEAIKEDEEVLEMKRVYVEDEEVSEVRRTEMKEAIKLAFIEAVKAGLGKITGELVTRFLPGDHEANRSQIVKKTGPDGTNLAIAEQILKAGTFYTEEQAQHTLEKILEENEPARLGKDGEHGKRLTLEAVKRVLRPKKVSHVVLEFVTRIVKKRQIREKVVEYQPKREILEGSDYGI